MQSTAPQNLLKSAAYTTCSVACLAIHTARLAGNGLAIRRAVYWGVTIGSGVGSRSTRQADGQAFAAGLPVCLQPSKAR